MKIFVRKNIINVVIIGALLLVGLSVYFLRGLYTSGNHLGGTSGGSDSIYRVMDKLPTGKYEIAMAREQVKAYYSGNIPYYKQLTAYFEKRAAKEDNNLAWLYIKSNKASILLKENKPDSALLMAKEAESFAEDKTNVGLGNVYNTIANSYYHLGNQDSAKFYMTKGYLFATTQKIDIFIVTFAINLGTYYYDHLLFGAASYYFNTALEASKRIENTPLMLINNITSILSVQRK